MAKKSNPILLDGPVGSQLTQRGIETTLPMWSAAAIDDAPDVIRAIHREYAQVGATVHTANTFRTQPRTCGDRWKEMTRRAVELARQSTPQGHRIAGSMAPIEDCYRPDLSPGDAVESHRLFAQTLADAQCDLILCETFANAGEAAAAVSSAVATGCETWVALTAGPEADLMTPVEMAQTARQCVDLGAQAVLCNCTPATETLAFVDALVSANLRVPIGAYANAGHVDDQVGWRSGDYGAAEYAKLAQQWIIAGAAIVGGCCGTGPAHIQAVAKVLE